jgi:hypothetical protein
MSPTANIESKPYKGPDSYETEDADYFFGRNRESEAIVAKILSARCTLLHAQSGTGKTSILNARVIPALEEQTWSAFRILPRHNPSDAVRNGSMLGLLPPPDAELHALNRLVETYWSPGDDPSLGEIFERFDDRTQTPSSDPRRRRVLLPFESSLSVPSAGFEYVGTVRPLFLRLLRATLEISQYSDHLTTMGIGAEITDQTLASELRNHLGSPEAEAGYNALLTRIYIPTPSLRAFFENLVEAYGSFRDQFGEVLILDQFEELFTLFSDAGSRDKQLWRLRWAFIEQLEDLYTVGERLPLRYVISIRDEYIAQLDPLRRFIRDLESNAFHLSFLEKDEARTAISEPARLFGYTYSRECYDNIFNALLREDRFVEPAPLQIVCEKLWREQGRFLASQATHAGENEDEREVQFKDFPEGGTRAILDSFFVEVLSSLPAKLDRLETLEILEPLVTSNRTRNIVEKSSLVNTPFRDPKRREQLLQNLQDKRIVRVEHRLGGQFVEITHEFLISSILEKIRTVLNADQEFRPLRWGVRTLERFASVDFRAGASALLRRGDFRDLHESRENIHWNDWTSELMYRSAITLGQPDEVVREWAHRFQASGDDLTASEIVSERRMRDGARSMLSLEELAILNVRPPDDLTADQIEFIFRSQVQQASDRESDLVIRWIKELMRVCREETHS